MKVKFNFINRWSSCNYINLGLGHRMTFHRSSRLCIKNMLYYALLDQLLTGNLANETKKFENMDKSKEKKS